MKKNVFCLLNLFLVSLLLSGCALIGPSESLDQSGETSFSSNLPSASSPESSPTSSSSDPEIEQSIYQVKDPEYGFIQRTSKEEVTYEDLFNLHNKVEIQIDVDREELQKINDETNYGGFASNKPETYHLAKKFTLTLHNGDNEFVWEVENVGIRQKGNTSRKPIFWSNGEVRNQNHFKISFDETFTDPEMYSPSFIAEHGNPEYEDREFLGLTGIDFKWNKMDDLTHVKEVYSSKLLRSAGILVQHIGLCTVKMAYEEGEAADFGLCTLFEASSKSFIKRSLQSKDLYINMPSWSKEKEGSFGVKGKKYGDLYKASYGGGSGSSWGADFTSDSIEGERIGVKTDILGYDFPTYERKTNQGSDYNDDLMRETIALLNSRSATFEQLAEKIDTQYLAMEEAVMYFLGNPDAMRYNYNNYLVYFRRTDGKMVIVPIDNDRVFGIGCTWADGLEFILNSNCTPNNPDSISGEQRNPLLCKTIFARVKTQAKTDYQECLKLVKDSPWLDPATFERFYGIAKDTYQGEATFSLDGGTDNISFQRYVDAKLQQYQREYPAQ